jgi:predicted nucleic acid-binding protein
MLAGVDTGFFYALQDSHPAAISIWNETEVATSTIVLYELQKKLLQGQFRACKNMLEDIKNSVLIVPLTVDIALKAGHIAHGTGMPGLDALIMSSLVEAGCHDIYTTDHHFELYKKKGIRIVNLAK